MAGVRRRHFLSLSCLFAFPLLFCHSLTIASLAPSTMVALIGRDVILPCSFTPHPSMNLLRMVVTWQLLDTDAVVHSYYYQRDQLDLQDPAYLHRTKFFPDELLEGNASLQLNIVRLEDEAQYMCTVSNEFGSSSGTVKLLVAAPYSEPLLTFDLQACLSSGLVRVLVTGGYPKAEVEWISARGDNVSEEANTEFQTGPGGLYSITSRLHDPQGNGTNYTFILRNQRLKQEMIRSLAIEGSCPVEVRAQLLRWHVCFGITVVLLILTVASLAFLLHRKSRLAGQVL